MLYNRAVLCSSLKALQALAICGGCFGPRANESSRRSDRANPKSTVEAPASPDIELQKAFRAVLLLDS